MKLQEIYNHLDKLSPFELQEKWDNSGLIVGDMSREVSQVVVALDIDEEMIETTEVNTLFVVHHPLIFGNMTQLDFAKYPSNLIEKMILKKQSLIALHTNFDQTHLNRYVFEKVLGFKLESQDPFVCTTKGEWHYKELLTLLKEKLNLPTLKVIGKKEKIMVDIGHYESEKFFAEIILDELKVLPLLAIISHSKNPFHIETL
jgi:putative NIF3 family GTP cyclohydrolase 1 type 2